MIPPNQVTERFVAHRYTGLLYLRKSFSENNRKRFTNDWSTISAREPIEQPMNPGLKSEACQMVSATPRRTEDQYQYIFSWIFGGLSDA
jgi:hypothetical protein